jgi:inhibitor of cysteine peptidase
VIDMDGYIKIALVVCVSATMLTSGTIVYAFLRGGDDRFQETGSILSSFSDYDELTDFLKDASYLSGYSDYSFDYFISRDSDAAASEGSHSETNIQVSGVDEADIVKTDGEHILVASDDEVTITRAYPSSEMEVICVLNESDIIPFKTEDLYVHVSGLYIQNDRLVVLSSTYVSWWWYYSAEEALVESPVDTERAFVSVFDISDMSEPKLEMAYGISGYSLTSRMIDDVVYIVAQAYVWNFDDDPCVPRLWEGNDSSAFDPGLIYYDPGSVSKNSFVNILAVDVISGGHTYMSVIAGYASTVYMSPDALFLTFQKGGVQILMDDMVAMPEDEASTWTTIHKVSVDGLSMLPVARGDVRGWLLNQFSMDERDDMLRVATTTSWDEPENGVYVLNSTLSVVGSLEGLAPTERIYAARFLGDVLYLVTFLQMDPLFVIDLSNPTDPKVLGELEIPGFSTYLHPVDDNHVLGIGRIGEHVKLSLFDVSDPTAPTEQDLYIVPEMSWTVSSYEHKSVLFDLERELLVIPVTTYDYSPEDGNVVYCSTAYVFRVSLLDGISPRGIIEHGGNEYYNQVLRSLYIEDSLYTLSMTTLKANSLLDMSEEGTLVFDPDPTLR